jgi:hypothetical protein
MSDADEGQGKKAMRESLGKTKKVAAVVFRSEPGRGRKRLTRKGKKEGRLKWQVVKGGTPSLLSGDKVET